MSRNRDGEVVGQTKQNKKSSEKKEMRHHKRRGICYQEHQDFYQRKSQGTDYETVQEVSCTDRQGKQSSIPEVIYLNVPFLILFSEVFECPFSNTLF